LVNWQTNLPIYQSTNLEQGPGHHEGKNGDSGYAGQLSVELIWQVELKAGGNEVTGDPLSGNP
jgi:hypothetical protein